MEYLKFNNEKIYIEKNNKIILTNYNWYLKFMNEILNINENKNSRAVEINGLKLNNKNTLIIDLTSVSSVTRVFSNANKIIDEYIKTKLDSFIINVEQEEIMNNSVNELLEELYHNSSFVELDLLKILRNYSDVAIKNSEDFIKVVKELTKSETLKKIILIYKKSLFDFMKLHEIKELDEDKITFFEICDKKSILMNEDNIIIFGNEIFQITYAELSELIYRKFDNFDSADKELYEYLINKTFFYSIDEKEVDIMRKHINEIEKINKILSEEFKLNLNNTLDYI